jgi:hypothetical protein
VEDGVESDCATLRLEGRSKCGWKVRNDSRGESDRTVETPCSLYLFGPLVMKHAQDNQRAHSIA